MSKCPVAAPARSGRLPVGKVLRDDDDLDVQIKAIVDLAPKLSAAQRDRLAALLAVEQPAPERRGR